MVSRLCSLGGGFVLLLALSMHAQVQLDPELRKRADAVRATEAEMLFKQIPWVTDTFEAFRLAKEEARPIFVYMITGDPLDDC